MRIEKFKEKYGIPNDYKLRYDYYNKMIGKTSLKQHTFFRIKERIIDETYFDEKRQISIPDNVTLIIGTAVFERNGSDQWGGNMLFEGDNTRTKSSLLCLLFPTTFYFHTYPVKNKISVSIIAKGNLEEDLEMLHWECRKQVPKWQWRKRILYNKFPRKYENGWIRWVFKKRFIYSFVLDEELIEQIFEENYGTVVIPESLIDHPLIKNILDKGYTNIYLDKGH